MLVNIHLQLFTVCCESDFLTDQFPLYTNYVLGTIEEVLSGFATQKSFSVVFHGNDNV